MLQKSNRTDMSERMWFRSCIQQDIQYKNTLLLTVLHEMGVGLQDKGYNNNLDYITTLLKSQL